MRIKKSFLNAFSNSAILIIRSLLLFIVRIVFVKTLGASLLGVDSLFTNLLIVLSITDLGISTAINYSLYKPLHEKDYNKINALMTFYRKMYYTLGIFVLAAGTLVIPFLNIIVTEHINHIYLIYILYLLTTASTYFVAYKESLLYADQNNYETTFIVGVTYIIIYLLRIGSLLIYPSIIIYILILLFGSLTQHILINIYITRKYKKVDFKSKKSISKKEEKEISKSIKSMFLYKVGNYLVTGTDSLIISANKALGVAVVGIYINYVSITSMLDSIIYRGLSGVTASFGDLAVSEDKNSQENVYNVVSFISYMIYGLFAVGLYILLTPFIKMCFGSGFVLSRNIILIICLNFYLLGVLKPLDIVKDATGLYNPDKYVTLIQTVINLIVSIALCKMYGLIGVVLGTLISTILIPLWNKPYMVYKHIFKQKVYGFIFKQSFNLLSLIISFISIKWIVSFININNNILNFIVSGIVIVVLFVIINIIINIKTKEVNYLKNLIKRYIKREIK